MDTLQKHLLDLSCGLQSGGIQQEVEFLINFKNRIVNEVLRLKTPATQDLIENIVFGAKIDIPLCYFSYKEDMNQIARDLATILYKIIIMYNDNFSGIPKYCIRDIQDAISISLA